MMYDDIQLFGAQAFALGQELTLHRVRREAPMTLQFYPGLQIPAMKRPIRWEPECGVSVPLRPIGRCRDGDQRVGIDEVVSVPPPLRRRPGVAPTAMHLGQRDEVVDIQVSRIGEHPARVGVFPPPGDNLASPGVERHRDGALGDQDFVPGVLAIAVGVDPAAV